MMESVKKHFLARNPAGEAAYMFTVSIPENGEQVCVENSSINYISLHQTQYGTLTGNFSAGYISAPDSYKCEEISESQFETYKEMTGLPSLPVNQAKFLLSVE